VEEVFFVGFGGSHNPPTGEDYLDRVDCVVKESVLERAAFAGCACKTTTDGNTWEFHDYWWDETMLEG